MFTTEQLHHQKLPKTSERRVLRSGMALVKPVVVKNGFTYRELTLVFGICVALIVAITVWSSRKNETASVNDAVSSSVVENPLQELVKRSVSLISRVTL